MMSEQKPECIAEKWDAEQLQGCTLDEWDIEEPQDCVLNEWEAEQSQAGALDEWNIAQPQGRAADCGDFCVELRHNRRVAVITREDDETFTLPRLLLARAGWQAGQPLTPEVLAEAQQELPDFARQKAFSYLALRDFGCVELQRKLCEQGVPLSLAEQIIRKLRNAGLLDDQRYAERRVESALRQGKSSRNAALGLQRRGIDREVTQSVMPHEPAELESALFTCAKLWPRYQKKERGLHLLTDAMARRGFSWNVIRQAVEQTTHADPENEDA